MDSKYKKRLRVIRDLEYGEDANERFKRARAAEREEREKSPEFIRDKKRREILQKISIAWGYAQKYKKQHKQDLPEEENLKIKKLALQEAENNLINLICADIKNLIVFNIAEKSVKQILNYYNIQIEVYEKRAAELGIKDALEQLNLKLEKELENMGLELPIEVEI